VFSTAPHISYGLFVVIYYVWLRPITLISNGSNVPCEISLADTFAAVIRVVRGAKLDIQRKRYYIHMYDHDVTGTNDVYFKSPDNLSPFPSSAHLRPSRHMGPLARYLQ
jgi:hypothetical protein